MIACAKRNSVRGFTLVELLVVIGIIAILVGLSFPAFSAMMSRARNAKCISNLHQIGQAMITFAGDNNANLPTSGGYIPWGSTDTPPPTGSGLNGWTQQLAPYTGITGDPSVAGAGATIFQCPDWQKVTANGGIYPNQYYSYFNGSHAADAAGLASSFSPVSIMKIQNPSAHIIAGDIAFSVFADPSNGLTDCDKDDYGANNPAFSHGGTIPIHNGFVNLAFADGHIEHVNKYDNTTMTTHYEGINTSKNYTAP